MSSVAINVLTSTATQDTSAVAYVTRPSGPPDNSGFMNGAYAVAIVIYIGYIALMMRRMSQARRVAATRASRTHADASRRDR